MSMPMLGFLGSFGRLIVGVAKGGGNISAISISIRTMPMLGFLGNFGRPSAGIDMLGGNCGRASENLHISHGATATDVLPIAVAPTGPKTTPCAGA